MLPFVWAFDLDGVLINTREINRQAYETVGVTIPDHVWGLAWHEWLPTYFNGDIDLAASIHRAKTAVYLRALIENDLTALELPALSVARGLHAVGPENLKIVTASATATANRLIDRLGLVEAERHVGLTYKARCDSLLGWDTYARVTYVDDNVNTIVRLTQDAPQIKTIHYISQDATTLRKEMSTL